MLTGIAIGLFFMAQAAQPAPDAARVLADVRQALGGDAAIAGLQSFSVSGSESHSAGGHSAGSDVEFLCALPDRFLHVRRLSSPFGTTTEEYGFNGNERIRRRDSDMPYPPDPGENDPPAQKAQRAARALANTKRDFARMVFAMIGVPAIESVDVTYAGAQTVNGRNVDVLVVHAADGYEAKLFVDATTHLPWMTSWMGAPIVTATSTSTVIVPQGQMPRMPAPSFPRCFPIPSRFRQWSTSCSTRTTRPRMGSPGHTS